MKILMIASEVAPFVKVGGLADVVGALPKALKKLGHDVRVVCPLYGGVRPADDWKPLDGVLFVHMGDAHRYARVWEATLPMSDVPIYFIEHDHYFGRHEVYTGPWGAHGDNGERFTFLSRAGIDLCYFLDWLPDVFHVHDWPTALVPVMLNAVEYRSPLSNSVSVLTIHNLEHQGYFPSDILRMAGLPDWTFREDGLEAFGRVNMLKGGIYHATKLTAVSPAYAEEIKGEVGGNGLHRDLMFRAGDLVGILNGIDTEVWNPKTDPLLPANYSAGKMAGKNKCKEALQAQMQLEVDPTIPLFGVISRLVTQKGLDLLRDICVRAVRDMRVQFAILGSGEHDLQQAFYDMPGYCPGKIGSYIGFNNDLAHLMTAGSDFFIMPSRFEPCGLTQMYSMVYGTLPVARATGGLKDTVEQYVEGEDAGTGFLFEEASSHALYYTIGWACSTYYDRKAEFRKMRLRGMKKDFSWESSAKRYVEIYRWALEKKGRYNAR